MSQQLAMPRSAIQPLDYAVAALAVVLAVAGFCWWIMSEDARLMRAFSSQGAVMTATVTEVADLPESFGARRYALQYHDGAGKTFTCGFDLPGYERLRGNTFRKGQRIPVEVLVREPSVCRPAPRG